MMSGTVHQCCLEQSIFFIDLPLELFRSILDFTDVSLDSIHTLVSKKFHYFVNLKHRKEARECAFDAQELDLRKQGCDNYEARYMAFCIRYMTSAKLLQFACTVFDIPLNILAVCAASKSGHLDVVKWLRVQNPPCPWGEDVCSSAAGNGHLDVLQWARSQDPPCRWGTWILFGAASKGHLAVLQYALYQDPVPLALTSLLCTQAAQDNQLEVLQWLRAQNPPCPWNTSVSLGAVSCDNFDVIKWLRAQDPPCPWDEGVCMVAARLGNLDILRWARSQNPPCPWQRQYVLDCTTNQDVIDWILQQSS